MIRLSRCREHAGSLTACVKRAGTSVALLAGLWLSALSSLADEVRPAYLLLREETPGQLRVLFKTPMRGDARLALDAVLSGDTERITPVATRTTGDAAVQTWQLRAREPLAGRQVRIAGLEGTVSDALVRIEFADGSTWMQRLTPQQPAATIPARQNGWGVAGIYLRLGVEHILMGVDHLLFVLALIMIARTTWQLVQTVTAFTLAHSITLTLATLGFVHVPSKPVEAVIALSIVFVAAEIVHLRQGREGVAARLPWLVAFVFGLLHGFGFAGALNEIGLPQSHIPVALLFFNLGVEAGQLLFVAAVLAATALVRSHGRLLPRWAELIAPYAIGSVAMFWTIERVAAF